jgi:hypothetical protein
VAELPLLTLGSRPSRLARRQTDLVATALRNAWPGLQAEVKIYTTRGDRELARPLPEIGGKGLFTAEIEAALRAGEIDLAVHSFKDLPIAEGAGLTVGLDYGDPLIACIGPVTAATASELCLDVDIVAKEYTIDGLLDALDTQQVKGIRRTN